MPGKGGRWIWIALAAAALLAIAGFVARDRGPVAPAGAGAAADSAVASTGQAARAPAATAATGASTAVPGRPLPAVGTPFRLSIDELQRRARAADPAAMCRLAAEHEKCAGIRASLEFTSRMLEGARRRNPNETPEDRARRLADTTRNAEQLIEESRHCDGVPPVESRELVRQWRAAALAGSPPALAHYGLGHAFPSDQLLSLLPELAVYRAEAEALARRAAEGGNVDAIVQLGMAYNPESSIRGLGSLIAQAVEPDRVESIALLRFARARFAPNPHMDEFFQTQLSRLEAAATPEEFDAAGRRLAALESTLGHRRLERHEPMDLVQACTAPGDPGTSR